MKSGLRSASLAEHARILERVALRDPINTVLTDICSMLESELSGAVATIHIYDQATETLVLSAAPSVGQDWKAALGEVSIASGSGSCARAVTSRVPVFCGDVSGDELWESGREMILHHGFATSFSQPLISRAGQVLGTLCVYLSRRCRPEDAEARSIDAAVNLARIALEHQKSEETLRESQKLESIGVLAGGIAHEFNNLLVGILGNASLALTELALESPARDRITAIERAALRAADLTNQLLAYAGQGQFVLEELDVSILVEEMAHLLEASLSKKATLIYDFAKDLPRVRADGAQIRQVALNLMTNASEALEDSHGTVSIRTGAMFADREYLSALALGDRLSPGEYAYLEVADTGCGIPEELGERMFEPFFSTKFTGRGLGLAAVAGIVRGHAGGIGVETEPGRGSVFRVLLPCLSEQVAEVPENAQEAPASTSSSGACVLVIDDEEMVRTVTQIALEREGFHVLTASDGREGVDLFAREMDSIGMVLLDMTMPRMSGGETFEELKKLKPDIPVILMSGYAEGDAKGRFSGQGLKGYLQKPFLPAKLVTKIKNILG